MEDCYFLVFFIGHTDNGTVSGNAPICRKNKFLNSRETIEWLEANANVTKCVITNIIKISKSDYDEWCRIS